MVVMPSDQLIEPAEAFQTAIRQAVTIVEKQPETLVTFGIKPTFPAENFGYIERGESRGQRSEVRGQETADRGPETGGRAFTVARFREKPARAVAAEYLASGKFYWNSGIFVWKAKTILEAIGRYEAEMLQHLEAIGAALGREDFPATLDREFTAIRPKSIDFAVMEHYQPVVVIEAGFQWDDVGSWQAMARSLGRNAEGNTSVGKHVSIRTKDSIVRTTEDHLVVTLGLENCIVVHTPDATLVASKDQEEAIRDVVKALEQRGWREYL
jgi:mannose-1-phosphate guanylyltransferase